MSLPGVPRSTHFDHQGGELACDGVPLARIAAEVDTPCYVYSAAAIDEAFRAIDASLAFAPHLVTYAIKANGNLAVLRRLAALGSGADIVSAGELARARKAGFPPERIVFSGVGKRRDEIAEALALGIRAIHVESVPELDVIEAEAARLGVVAKLSMRVNPDVDPQTHPYIATGLHDSKFGLELDVADALLPRLVASPHLELEGVATHIGSQLASPSPLRDAVAILGRFAVRCREAGAPLRNIDVGGGWPLGYGHEKAPYPPVTAFAEAIREGLAASGADALGLTVVTEPGRALVGDAGVLLTRVLYVKEQPKRRFVIVDAAMTELIRPALYQAHHAVVPVKAPPPGAELSKVDVVGPVCESGDFLAKERLLPPLEPGDLLAVRCAGAYGREMASTYNARPLAAEVLVDGGEAKVVRRRASLESLWAGED
jgi:diaminopimelate decarboxylase